MTDKKIFFSLKDLENELAKKKYLNKKIIHCHGVFDLLHIGHLNYFKNSKSKGDILIVTVTSDEFINKGPNRPYFNLINRLKMLSSLDLVDIVAASYSKTAIDLINIIKPNFYCKGPDYKNLKKDLTGEIYNEINAVNSHGGKIYFTDDDTFSSSKILNDMGSILNKDQFDFISKIKKKLDKKKLKDIFSKIKKSKVLIIGELIIDEYVFCEALGKSGKEPVLVMKNIYSEKYLGGAAIIANHISDFVDKVKLISIIGSDKKDDNFIKKNLKKEIKPEFIRKTNSSTITKKRYVENINMQKVLGVYSLDDDPLNTVQEKKLQAIIKKNIENYDIVIVADFGHGLVSKDTAKIIQNKSNFSSINAQINSSNISHHNIDKYKMTDCVIINETELRHEMRENKIEITNLMRKFIQLYKIKYLVVTKGKSGVLFLDAKRKDVSFAPAFAKNVVDKVGSGDAFLALMSLFLKNNVDYDSSIFISSIAAAQVVESVGNSKVIKKNEISKTIEHLLT